MTRARLQSGLAVFAAAITSGAHPALGQTTRIWTDPVGDAVFRRTDSGANGAVPANSVPPDLVRVTLGGWLPVNPATDPYLGGYVAAPSAHMFRLDAVFKGVVNPPGTLGLGPHPYNPHQFGPRPIHGFLEFDSDDQKDTGGDLDPTARQRYLANVARFGRRPHGSLGERVAVSAWDYDTDISLGPQYERTGGEFTLAFCGCHPTTIVNQVLGNGNGVFEPGEIWIVQSRYFRRNGGFTCRSNIFGGSGPKEYDPESKFRFSHNPFTNETTVTLVFPLDMIGAGQLMGLPSPPPLNSSAGDAVSILEALTDVVANAPFATGSCGILIGGWNGRDPEDYLDVTAWGVRGLVGTAYTNPEDSIYVWTDTGFEETAGDMNADGAANVLDRLAILAGIASLDGTAFDEDGIINGVVDIIDFGPNFHLLDADGDGFIRALDVSLLCPADFNGDGLLNPTDFGAFQTAFLLGDPRADFSHDGLLNVSDFSAFQTAFVVGCP